MLRRGVVSVKCFRGAAASANAGAGGGGSAGPWTIAVNRSAANMVLGEARRMGMLDVMVGWVVGEDVNDERGIAVAAAVVVVAGRADPNGKCVADHNKLRRGRDVVGDGVDGVVVGVVVVVMTTAEGLR